MNVFNRIGRNIREIGEVEEDQDKDYDDEEEGQVFVSNLSIIINAQLFMCMHLNPLVPRVQK